MRNDCASCNFSRRTLASIILLCSICFCIALEATGIRAGAQTPATDASANADWLKSLQFKNASLASFGGIKVHHTPGATSPVTGKQYFRVSPYSGNLAVRSLLLSQQPGSVAVAERWIRWYFDHLNPTSAADGVPFEHFYLEDGSGETVTVVPGDPRLDRYNDATDSAAATFFSVLRAFLHAGGSKAILLVPESKLRLHKMAGALYALQQPDGLFWAKANYRAKYLEDNCEVFEGLVALKEIENQVYYANPAGVGRCELALQKLKHGIITELGSPDGIWKVTKFEDGKIQTPDTDRWYPDMQCQLWPVLFGVVDAASAPAQKTKILLQTRWGGNGRPNWSTDALTVNGGFVNADVAYGAALLGLRSEARTYLKTVEAAKFPGAQAPQRFAWPFTPLDAGWMLLLCNALNSPH